MSGMTELRTAPATRTTLARRKLTTAAQAVQADATLGVAKDVGDRLVIGVKGLFTAAPTPAAEAPKGFLGGAKALFGRARDWVSETVSGLPGKAQKAFEWGQDMFYRHVMGASTADLETLTSVDDPSDVNDPSSRDLDAAKKALAANRAAETRAVAALPERERTRYQAVAKACEGSTLAQRGLQRLLLDGALPGARDLRGETTLLDQLHGLTTQPIAPGIDRGALVSEVVAEVENPVRINQHGKGTCGATTAQILLIRQNPAEYVRIVRGLASPSGDATMFGGKTISRHHDWAADNDNGRSNPSRMFQSAVMEFAQVIPFSHYDNTQDKTMLGPIGISGGLMPSGLVKALDQLTGKDYEVSTAWRWNRGEVYEKMKRLLAEGQGPLPVSLTWNGGGHFVQVDKIEGGKVTFTNPHGRVQTLDESEFRTVLTSVTHLG